MPFHRWYKWLEDKFQELRTAFVKETDDSDLNKWNQEADKEAAQITEKRRKKKGIFDKISGFLKSNK